jgi:polygalacturonase
MTCQNTIVIRFIILLLSLATELNAAIPIEGEPANAAIQAALDNSNAAHLPKRDRPYVLDGPIILKSGQKLTADADTVIQLKPGTNTCMVRNEHIVGFADKPVPENTNPNTDIHIEGGIWTTFGEGNTRGHSSKQAHVHGTHGVILLQNVRRVTVRNITVRRSKAFAVHLANARDFTVDGVTLDEHGRDGVHVNGPASDGLIRNVSGVSHDDTVALNAWEWKNYAPSFGAIHHIVIEDVRGAPDGVPSANSIRLLPGVKRFSDGTTLDCPIHDITIRNITDIRDFKLYDQPNLEVGRDNDASAGIGTLKNITFEKLIFNRSGSIQVHANTDGLTVRNVKLNFPPPADHHLIELGPKSQTYKHKRDEPATWVEIFSPDLDCTAWNITVSGVRLRDSQADVPIEQVVRVIELKPNPDYPKTTPKGGTGKGIWIR